MNNIKHILIQQGNDVYDAVRLKVRTVLLDNIEREFNVFVFADAHPTLLLANFVSLAVRDDLLFDTPDGISGPVYEQYWGSWGATSEDL